MSEKRYFVGLNSIRTIAAFLVIFHHLEQAKHAFDLPTIYHNPVVQHAGRLGVGLFFVLSGFLITYLLLEEKGRHGEIDTLKFYLRRAFRIWPIYFLIVALSLFVFPNIEMLYFPGTNEKLTFHFKERLLFLGLIFPNFAFVITDLPYWCAQTWSIGVEEQFYYLWPWLIKYPKWKFLTFLLFMIILISLLWASISLAGLSYDQSKNSILTFIGQFRIQIMALGGITASLVYYKKTRILNILFRRDLQFVAYLCLLILFFSGIHFTGFMEVYAVLFALFILNISCNPRSIIKIDNKWMDYLGRISYGLYIYHVAVSVCIINILRFYFPEMSGWNYQIVLYLLTFIFSILISSASYHYFEKPLLKFKDKYLSR